MFIQVFDKNYSEELKNKGLKVINSNDSFTLFAFDNKLKFDLDTSKAVFTDRMTF